MAAERSAGIILFRKTPESRKYLVIRSARDLPDRPEHWDFPKGLLDKGETGLEAALREVREEVGIENVAVNPEFKETVFYMTKRDGKPIPKYVALFLAETKTETITLSWEHDRYEWLSFAGARERISLKGMKEALEKAEKFLAAEEA
jgi:8-oxo-dGTP pyrophosphatase MutT (NUDIX family)